MMKAVRLSCDCFTSPNGTPTQLPGTRESCDEQLDITQLGSLNLHKLL